MKDKKNLILIWKNCYDPNSLQSTGTTVHFHSVVDGSATILKISMCARLLKWLYNLPNRLLLWRATNSRFWNCIYFSVLMKTNMSESSFFGWKLLNHGITQFFKAGMNFVVMHFFRNLLRFRPALLLSRS